MTTLQITGIVLIVLVLAVGIGLKRYTHRQMDDMDGLDNMVVGVEQDVFDSINRDQEF